MIGCEILAKAEMCNGGGSVKDRAAYFLIKDAEEKGNAIKLNFKLFVITAGERSLTFIMTMHS